MNKITFYPGKTIAGAACLAAAWKYTTGKRGVLGFLCLTMGSALLSKSVTING